LTFLSSLSSDREKSNAQYSMFTWHFVVRIHSRRRTNGVSGIDFSRRLAIPM